MITVKNFLTVGAFYCASLVAFGQDSENLISNGSFESTDKEPKKVGSIANAVGWYSPTGVLADLFTPNRKYPEIDAPLNYVGSEDAKDGTNYAGIVAFSYGDKMQRSYLSTKLNVPLKKGTKYCVEFYVSMAEGSKYASNQIGMNINKKAFGTEEKITIIDKTHVLHTDNKIFNGMYNWERVCGMYEAEGGEKYITIGNFTSNEDTKNERNKIKTDLKVEQVIAAYYYIDNVSIRLIDEDHPCDCAPIDETEGYSKTIYQKVPKINDDMTPAQKVEAQSLYFSFGSSSISQLGTDALDAIVAVMKANPEMKLQIKGFSDVTEDEASADKAVFTGMDGKRVNSVMLYLMEKGIAEARLISSPQGSTETSADILESDEDDIKQAKNRRVEFKVR